MNPSKNKVAPSKHPSENVAPYTDPSDNKVALPTYPSKNCVPSTDPSDIQNEKKVYKVVKVIYETRLE